MEPCFSEMWVNVTFGIFQLDSHTRSKVWDRMALNFCWYSIKARFPKTTPSFFPTGWRIPRHRCCLRILACRKTPLRNFQTEAYISFRRICLHRWHRTKPLLGAVGPNPLTNTPLEWMPWLPRSKRAAVKLAWLTRIISWRQNTSPQLWLTLNRVVCVNCTGTPTLLNGNT